MSAQYDFVIRQGATLTFTITLTGVNLTGATVSMQGRASHAASTAVLSSTGGSPNVSIAVTAGTNSVVTVSMSASATAALTAPSYGVWDIQDDIAGVVTRRVEGTFYVTAEVTR